MMIENAKHNIDRLVGLIVTLSSGQKQITQTALDLQAMALSKKREIKVQLDLSDDLADIMKVLVERLENIIPVVSWCEAESTPESGDRRQESE